MLKQPKKRLLAQKIARLAALALAGLCLVCVVTAISVDNYQWSKYTRYANERQAKLSGIVNYLEFGGLDETVMAMMAEHSQKYTDYSNFVITDSTGRVLYALNQGYLDGSGYLLTCTNGSGDLYTINAQNEPVARYIYESNDITPLANLTETRYSNMRDITGTEVAAYNGGWAWRQVYYAGLPTKDMHLYFFFDSSSPKWNPAVAESSSLSFVTDVAGPTGVLSFMLYWTALPVWVFLDARRRDDRPALWGVLALFTNIVGLIVYLCVRQEIVLCAGCKEPLERGYVVCPVCGLKSRARCDCGHLLEDHWVFCPKCGKSVEAHEEMEAKA